MSSVPAHPDVSSRSAAAPVDGAVATLGTSDGDEDSVERRIARVFGDDGARHRHPWVTVVAVVAALALVAGAALHLRGSGSATDRYVTAEATTADVAARLQNVASIEPVSQATVGFPVSGTVAAVDVAVGDTVSVGQQLAQLDTGALTDALHEKEATLAQARLTLQQALDGGSTSSPSTGGSSAAGGSSGRGGTGTLSSSQSSTGGSTGVVFVSATQQDGTGNRSAITAAQQAVVTAQQQVDAAMTAADAALSSATAVCSATSSASSGATSTGSHTAAPASSATTTTVAATDDAGACTAALQAVQAAQQQVATAQQQLAASSSTLDGLLAAEAASGTSGSGASGATGSPGSPGPMSGTSGPGSSGTPSAGGGSGTTPTPSAAQLVADQKAVDAAEAAVTVAEQAVSQASVHTPIAGTVVAVAIATGDSVSAGSATQTVTVRGDRGDEVVTTVGLDDIATIAVGQHASLVPDGRHAPLSGKVVAVSTVPESSAGTTTFRVTVGLDDPASELGNGATGTVTITTASATRALTVPTSAVHTTGDRHSVVVLDGGTTRTAQVQVGVIGADRTEVTSGVQAGTTVVLADRDEALPSSATDSSGAGSRSGTDSLFPGGGPGGGAPPNFVAGGR